MVDKLVSTPKILLYTENSYISNPLIFIMLGKIYLEQHTLQLRRQSVRNFSFSSKSVLYSDAILIIFYIQIYL